MTRALSLDGTARARKGRLVSALIRYRNRKRDPLDLLRQLTAGQGPFRKLIHVGAHLAQEADRYETLGYDEVLWIEGSPGVFERMRTDLGSRASPATRHHTCCALLSETAGQPIELRQCSNDGMSSSIFPLKANSWPGIVETGVREAAVSRTLDDVAAEFGMSETTDTLVVDVQGAELLVLKGGEKLLGQVRAVVTEISRRPYYEGGVLYPELRAFLEAHHFFAMSRPRRHGDGVFLRSDCVSLSRRFVFAGDGMNGARSR